MYVCLLFRIIILVPLRKWMKQNPMQFAMFVEQQVLKLIMEAFVACHAKCSFVEMHNLIWFVEKKSIFTNRKEKKNNNEYF